MFKDGKSLLKRLFTYFISTFGICWTFIETIGFFFKGGVGEKIGSWNNGFGFWILVFFSLVVSGVLIRIQKFDYKESYLGNDNIDVKRIAEERIRTEFSSMKLWGCKWVWNWSSEFEPVNIRGFCTGDDNPLKILIKDMRCDYPVDVKVMKRYGEHIAGVNDIGLVCTRSETPYHKPLRATFTDVRISEMASTREIEKIVISRLKEVILNHRDEKIKRYKAKS